MTEYVLNKSFTSYVERSPRVIKVAEAFGIGLEDKDFTVLNDLKIDVEQGEVIFITGQSGSGKSCLLRELSAAMAASGKKVASIDDVEFLDKPLIDQIGKDMAEATNLLAQAGLSDAYLWIRKPSELSDGQRYRFCLAKLLEQDCDVWVADEFGAVLDRVTAQIVAFSCQKVARKHKRTLIVATTHDDIIEPFGPSIVIRKKYNERVTVSRGTV